LADFDSGSWMAASGFRSDIDYHWEGDLDAKQQELLRLCRRVILRQVGLQTGYQGSASVRTGPDADAPNARFIDLRFWKVRHQIEIPIEITRIVCLDAPTIRTADGTVHVTPSDADLDREQGHRGVEPHIPAAPRFVGSVSLRGPAASGFTRPG
jgi:hypothetical protein